MCGRLPSSRSLISNVPGLVSYYIIHDGSGTVSVTVAQDKAGVDESNDIARTWLAEHASEVHVSTPHITGGEVLITTSG